MSNRSTPAPAQHSPGDILGEVPEPPAEHFTVEIITGGVVSEYTADLSRVPHFDHFANEADLAALMRVLEPLRSWLEIHGALTPGSGVLVRTLPEPIRKIIGDLSDTDRVLVGLQLRPVGTSPT